MLMCFNRDSYKVTKTIMIIASVAISVFVIGSTTAMIMEHRYKFDKQFLSELGIRHTTTGEGAKLTSALFPEVFNITLIITGILISPFFIGVYKTLKPEKTIQKIFFIGTSVMGTFTGITLALVGVFDLGYFYYAHMTVAGLFSIGAISTGLLWGIGVLTLKKDSPYKQSKVWIIDPIISLLILGVGLIYSTFGQAYPEIFGFISIPLYQKLFVYVIFVLMIVIIIRFFSLLKKEKKTRLLNQQSVETL